jgi:hypothetical protein
MLHQNQMQHLKCERQNQKLGYVHAVTQSQTPKRKEKKELRLASTMAARHITQTVPKHTETRHATQGRSYPGSHMTVSSSGSSTSPHRRVPAVDDGVHHEVVADTAPRQQAARS